MKICAKCKIEKSSDCFYKNRANKDGLQYSCKECDSQRRKQHYKNNIEYYLEYSKGNSKEYRKNNKEKVSKLISVWVNKRRKNDSSYRLRTNVSNSVRQALKKNNSSKLGGSILKHLAYTMKELKTHLEAQFDQHMSWDNYGIYWHIDHIIPQSKLAYVSMEDDNFKKCWALSNLQPLEKIANIKKGNKICCLEHENRTAA